jgi:hypothetical protein
MPTIKDVGSQTNWLSTRYRLRILRLSTLIFFDVNFTIPNITMGGDSGMEIHEYISRDLSQKISRVFASSSRILPSSDSQAQPE